MNALLLASILLLSVFGTAKAHAEIIQTSQMQKYITLANQRLTAAPNFECTSANGQLAYTLDGTDRFSPYINDATVISIDRNPTADIMVISRNTSTIQQTIRIRTEHGKGVTVVTNEEYTRQNASSDFALTESVICK